MEASIAQASYDQVMQEYRQQLMPPHSKEHRMVQRVLERLIPHSGLQDQEWETFVIDSDEKNAFVVPGGKVFVFRGILDVCQGEDGLAAVLGHEISHNVAHHAAERMSQNLALMLLLGVGILFTGGDYLGLTNYLLQLVFTLPGSRAQESEADYIGLLMMAESCYNPSAAMGLWSRMEKLEQNAPPQFLSTHPSNHNRLEKIREWLPQAEGKLENSDCGATAVYGTFLRRMALQ